MIEREQQLVAMLRQLEWSDNAHGFGGQTAPRCHLCFGIKDGEKLNVGGGKRLEGKGHTADCKLAALLKDCE